MLNANLLIGLVWGIWHLPLFFYPTMIQYDWIHESIWLAAGFIVNCVTNAFLYNIFYVISERRVFVILFVHMFENIVLTGIMIYPFSKEYSELIIPVSIIIDIMFYVIMSRTALYKRNLQKIIKRR